MKAEMAERDEAPAGAADYSHVYLTEAPVIEYVPQRGTTDEAFKLRRELVANP